jgi:hypothetical protein
MVDNARSGTYVPRWLLERRRRAEQALISAVATSCLLGVSTRRVEKLVGQRGIAQLSKSQVSEMAKSLDVQVEAFRSRPLDASEAIGAHAARGGRPPRRRPGGPAGLHRVPAGALAPPP